MAESKEARNERTTARAGEEPGGTEAAAGSARRRLNASTTHPGWKTNAAGSTHPTDRKHTERASNPAARNSTQALEHAWCVPGLQPRPPG